MKSKREVFGTICNIHYPYIMMYTYLCKDDHNLYVNHCDGDDTPELYAHITKAANKFWHLIEI